MDTQTSPRTLWPWITAVWLGVGLFTAGQTVLSMRAEGMHHPWSQLFFFTLLAWLPWGVATAPVLTLGRMYPPLGWRPIRKWIIHLVACAVMGGISAAWLAWLETALNPLGMAEAPGPFLSLWRNTFYDWIPQFLFVYTALLAIRHILDAHDRLVRQQVETARLNEQLSKAQLDALRHQIEPHFLFNTLNAVAGLVREERNDAAVSMIVGLSEFLRKVIADSNRQQVPLAEEMEFLQTYLDIQKVRFAERLRVSVDVPAELFPAQVPSLILQPMVENALKHGIARRAYGGEIRIAAARSNGVLTLSVYNDGPQLPPDWEKTHTGIGISNARTRLRCLYGDAFEFRMQNQDPGGVEVSVSVPFREQ